MAFMKKSTVLQLRSGTSAETAGFTGLKNEVTIDEDLKNLVVHDGLTAGGFVVGEAQAQAASTSEANALASEQAAALSETNASTSEANALASENAASTSETNALASESAALSYEQDAYKWAEETVDVEVDVGEYSAKHHKVKAGEYEVSAFNSAGNALASEQAAATSEANALAYATSMENAKMIGNLMAPLLDLPLKNSLSMKAGVGLVTFSRNSEATYVDRYGTLRYAAVNEPRFEKEGLLIEGGGDNLVSNPENFSDSWLEVNDVVVLGNQGVAPDGSISADKLGINTGGTDNRIRQNVTIPDGSQEYTATVFFKYISIQYVTLRVALIGGTTAVETWTDFDLINGVTANESTNAPNPSIVNVGNGWYRCSITTTNNNSGNVTASLRIGGSIVAAPTETGSIYLWGAQLEEQPFASSYMPSDYTFTSRASEATYVGSDGLIKEAAIDVARYQYNPENLTVDPFLLLEESRTNLLTDSEEFDNAAWIKVNVLTTSNTVTAPDGSLSADKLVETASTAEHYVEQTVSPSGNIITYSVYAKAAEHDSFWLRPVHVGADQGSTSAVSFTLTGEGSIPGLDPHEIASIQNVGNGWYKCVLTLKLTGTITSFKLRVQLQNDTGSLNYTGDGSSGIYVWGAQVEEGHGPTSYIPTTTAAVTRSADVYSEVLGSRASEVLKVPYPSNFPDLGGHLSICADYDSKAPTGTDWRHLFEGDSANDNLFLTSDRPDGNQHLVLLDNYHLFSPVTGTEVVRLVVSSDGSTFMKIYADGSFHTEESTPVDIIGKNDTQFVYLGSSKEGIKQIFGHISNFRIYDRALTAAEAKVA